MNIKTYWQAPIPADRWTLRHRWRYGRDPAKTADDWRRYHNEPRPTPWLFRGDNDQIALVVICVVVLAWLWS